MAEVTIWDALENIQSSKITESRSGVEEFKHILRHNKNNSKINTLKDSDFHKIFELLFHIAIETQPKYLHAKTSSTRTAAADRLSGAASAVRDGVEAGVRSLKGKTVRAVLSHVTDTITFQNGELCEPLALDFARTMRAILSFQPHVEHLNEAFDGSLTEWERLVNFCAKFIADAGRTAADENELGEDGFPSPAATLNGLSHRSSRSTFRDSADSQVRRSANKAVVEELVACLRLLTSAPNGPLRAQASTICWAVIEVLRTSAISGMAHSDAFATINNVLAHLRTEDIAAIQKLLSHLLRLVRRLWSNKSSGKSQMLMTVWLIRPMISHAMKQHEHAVVLQPELVSMVQTLEAEYSGRHDRDKMKMLAMDELVLRPTGETPSRGEVATSHFSLRCASLREETNWLHVCVLAFLHGAIMDAEEDSTQSDRDYQDDEHGRARPKKRQRLADTVNTLIDAASKGDMQARTCALQTLAFLAQARPLSWKHLRVLLEGLSSSCAADDNGAVSSWAYLALASCASQSCATDDRLAACWQSLWQLASRSLSSTSTCRAASYTLYVMLHLQLASQGQLTELLQTMTNTMDLNGPSQLSDGASYLLCTLMSLSQQYNPISASKTADSIVGWLSRSYTPSRLNDKQYLSYAAGVRAGDIVYMARLCLGQSTRGVPASEYPVWDSVAKLWLLCEEEESLIQYLLLKSATLGKIDSLWLKPRPVAVPLSGQSPRLSSEALLLSHLIAEVESLSEAWERITRPQSLAHSVDAFITVCNACTVFVWLSFGTIYKDLRRQNQLQRGAIKLLEVVGAYISSPRCDQTSVDMWLTTLSTGLSNLHDRKVDVEREDSKCEEVICRTLRDNLFQRQRIKANSLDEDDPMDLDEPIDSQSSQPATLLPKLLDSTSDLDVTFGIVSLRSGVALYANAFLAVLDETMSTGTEDASASTCITDYILAQPQDALLASRDIIVKLPDLGVLLATTDIMRLMEHLSRFLNKYTLNRSEVALGTILDIFEAVMNYWTDPAEGTLYNLGLDIYEWYAKFGIHDNFFSPNVQKRLSNFLLRLCHADPDYGGRSEQGSARSICFQLIRKITIKTHHYLTDRMPSLFGRLVLSVHEGLFYDLQDHLPEDTDWNEGIAMRLLYLSKLATSWPSLLRSCLWLIFEVAARVPTSIPHATHCIADLASSLPLKSPQRLFSMFAPQLLYSWLALKKDALQEVPYSVFQYSSLHELLRSEREEVLAQLVMRGDESGMNLMTKALKTMPKDAIRTVYAKCVAYCIGRDVDVKQNGQHSNPNERRLWDSIGGRPEHDRLIEEQWPVVIGYLFLTLRQDSSEEMKNDRNGKLVYESKVTSEEREEKWLKDRVAYKDEYSRLAEMKANGHSDCALPQDQEPGFKKRVFCDRFERVCRRIGATPQQVWTPSRFNMVARMLVDAIDESLGSLHSCLTIRRLRVLIAMAGKVALDGFAVEMLIHSLRPFINDSECADDVLGILRYLFQHGSDYLGEASNFPFTTGAAILLLVSISKHIKTKHQSTSLQSQHQETVRNMFTFREWLVEYLVGLAERQGSSQLVALKSALIDLHLPGNARRGSPESQLLLFLLDQWTASQPLCSRADVSEALRSLSENFELPDSVPSDCLGVDEDSSRYSEALWEILETKSVSDQFAIWAASVVGRAYAATGTRPVHRAASHWPTSSSATNEAIGTIQSQRYVVQELSRTLYSRDRNEAGLAELTLRNIRDSFVALNQAEELSEFHGLLSDPIFAAVSEGTFGYASTTALLPISGNCDEAAVSQALEVSYTTSVDVWTAHLATVLSGWASSNAVVSSLGFLIRRIHGLARNMLPSMIHILLAGDKKRTLRTLLSSAVASHMSDTSPALCDKQQFLLSLIQYLRSQPLPGEKTMAERLRWIDIDHALASAAASRCGMPACALLLSETASSVSHEPKHTSNRASLLQAAHTVADTTLLLSIYKQMEEPDSFYGVQQTASLGSVLSRLDHEEHGFRSLMFRSAQMDSKMRQSHQLDGSDAIGMVQSLTALNFNSLAFALATRGLGDPKACSDRMLTAAQNLQQWNITPPEASASSKHSFAVLQQLSGASDVEQIVGKCNNAVLGHIKAPLLTGKSAVPPPAWFNELAVLSEIVDITTSKSEEHLCSRWSVMKGRQDWMRLARFDDVYPVIAGRQTTLGVLSQNTVLHDQLHLSQRTCQLLEVEALLASSSLARGHARLQEALIASTTLSDMLDGHKPIALRVEAAVKCETALVLWDAGETTSSVAMLRDTLDLADFDNQDVPIGISGLNARLAHQLGEARLEKPEEIMSTYLKPAIATIGKCRDQQEAGRVFYEFASFCDKELQNPGNIENFNRTLKLRQGREEELAAINQAMKDTKKTGGSKPELQKSLQRAQQWLKIDKEEEERLRKSRKNYIARSLEHYLRALNASDAHDICVLRFFALWLENAGEYEADSVVVKHLPQVSSWKFVRLMNQLISRVEDDVSSFQTALRALMVRIFREHPFHSFHHLYAAGYGAREMVGKDATAQSRYRAANSILKDLHNNLAQKDLISRLRAADNKYKILADNAPELPQGQSKVKVKYFPQAQRVVSSIPGYRLPPITVNLPLKPSGNYNDAPIVTGFDDYCSVMGGISAPKLLTARASDGRQYKELFKSGRDDLRQDGIMEQVFEEVSKMLRNHKATRQRDLKVRTYKVIPLAKTSGVIEFVPNSVPINDYLRPAHERYYPSDMKDSEARSKIAKACAAGSFETRLKVFRYVCDHLHPVMRHFFLERFSDPDDWFEKRTAYTRTTASISVLGHILGLGDRHCSNILLDKVTGEVVHIDLGVSFEAGRVLPVPELIPFRLTRDIIDGMGTTGTEGVFRRCCEFTLDAVREDKDSIMTLLNVLRYDPLYEWSMSPLRAKRMQEAQVAGVDGGEFDENSSKKREEAAGEAERALSIVEKKLSKTLSTTATVNELIQQATDEKNLAVLFQGWAAFY